MTSLIKELKLSKLDAEILDLMFESKRTFTIQELRKSLPSRGDNLYRSIDRLTQNGIVHRIDSWPKRYSASQFEATIRPLLEQRRQELDQLIKSLGTIESESEIITVVPTREEYRKIGYELMNNTKSSIEIIASGSVQDKDFFKTHIDLINRGGHVKLLVTKYKSENLEMYKNWVKNGWEIRILNDYNFNLVIYDKEVSQLGIKPKDGTNEKYGIIIYNRFLTVFLFDLYQRLWENAERLPS